VTATSLPTATRYRRVVHCMGTVSFDVRTPGVGAQAVDEAERWLHTADATFSTYRADSEIRRLARGDIDGADCSPLVRGVLAECDRLHAATGGYFSMYATGSLDPSGYVKGWAIQRASDILATHGSIAHCVNGGGDVQCMGWAAAGTPWRIGIADPRHPGELVTAVSGANLAVATSGTAERGAHVVDPHSGRAADHLASITLVGAHLAMVEAYATAALAMGPAAREFVASLEDIATFAVRSDGSAWTHNWPGRSS
jgi:thiamine biosynthesis lipoprotein